MFTFFCYLLRDGEGKYNVQKEHAEEVRMKLITLGENIDIIRYLLILFFIFWRVSDFMLSLVSCHLVEKLIHLA